MSARCVLQNLLFFRRLPLDSSAARSSLHLFFSQALQLEAFAQKLARLHPTIPVVGAIYREVRATTELLIAQLHALLKSNIQLPACLKIIGTGAGHWRLGWASEMCL